jgi:hypothetical protein
VEVSRLPKDVHVEISCIAVKWFKFLLIVTRAEQFDPNDVFVAKFHPHYFLEFLTFDLPVLL